MEPKTIIAICLVVFIIGAIVFLKLRQRKNPRPKLRQRKQKYLPKRRKYPQRRPKLPRRRPKHL